MYFCCFEITQTALNNDEYYRSFSYIFSGYPSETKTVVTNVNDEVFSGDTTSIGRAREFAYYIDTIVLTPMIWEDKKTIRVSYQVRTRLHSSKLHFLYSSFSSVRGQ